MSRRAWLRAAAGAVLLAGVAGCGAPAGPAPRLPGAGHTVAVLYAASLEHLMQTFLVPNFHAATGYAVAGDPGGSQALANAIGGGLQRADVFISAAPSVDTGLMGGAGPGSVAWYATFAEAPLVIGYSASSGFAPALRTGPWYAPMESAGFRLGRTDPKLDPKGALTVQFVRAAAAYYHRPDLVRKVLGAAENPAQIFPEQDLVGRLQAGQLDAGFFYANEAVDAGIPTIRPPAAIDLAATFTVTIPSAPPDPAGAAAFVAYLLGPAGTASCRREGLTVLPPAVSGDASAMPAPVAAAVRAHGG